MRVGLGCSPASPTLSDFSPRSFGGRASDESFNLMLLKAVRLQQSRVLFLFPHELTACWATSLQKRSFSLPVWKPKLEHYSGVITPAVDRVLAGPRPLQHSSVRVRRD